MGRPHRRQNHHLRPPHRVLEGRFRKLLGRTPHAEIVRVQVERARELLTQTDLPLKTIAQRVGIPHAEYLSVVFKRATGQSPGAYRRGQRLRPAGFPASAAGL